MHQMKGRHYCRGEAKSFPDSLIRLPVTVGKGENIIYITDLLMTGEALATHLYVVALWDRLEPRGDQYAS
jgi:hypothetical protein